MRAETGHSDPDHNLIGDSKEKDPLALKLTIQQSVMYRLNKVEGTPTNDETQKIFMEWVSAGNSARFSDIFENDEKVQNMLGNDVTPESINVVVEYIAQKMESES